MKGHTTQEMVTKFIQEADRWTKVKVPHLHPQVSRSNFCCKFRPSFFLLLLFTIYTLHKWSGNRLCHKKRRKYSS